MVHLVFKQRRVRIRTRAAALFHFFLRQISQLPLWSKECSQDAMSVKVPQQVLSASLRATAAATGATRAWTEKQKRVICVPHFSHRGQLRSSTGFSICGNSEQTSSEIFQVLLTNSERNVLSTVTNLFRGSLCQC